MRYLRRIGLVPDLQVAPAAIRATLARPRHSARAHAAAPRKHLPRICTSRAAPLASVDTFDRLPVRLCPACEPWPGRLTGKRTPSVRIAYGRPAHRGSRQGTACSAAPPTEPPCPWLHQNWARASAMARRQLCSAPPCSRARRAAMPRRRQNARSAVPTALIAPAVVKGKRPLSRGDVTPSGSSMSVSWSPGRGPRGYAGLPSGRSRWP